MQPRCTIDLVQTNFGGKQRLSESSLSFFEKYFVAKDLLLSQVPISSFASIFFAPVSKKKGGHHRFKPPILGEAGTVPIPKLFFPRIPSPASLPEKVFAPLATTFILVPVLTFSSFN